MALKNMRKTNGTKLVFDTYSWPRCCRKGIMQKDLKVVDFKKKVSPRESTAAVPCSQYKCKVVGKSEASGLSL